MTRFPAQRLEDFGAELMQAVGAKPDHASTVAQRLVEGDLRGRHGHGVIRLSLYVQRIEANGMNLDPHIRAIKESPVSALIDGDNGLGQVVVTHVVETAIAKAKESGMAWVGCRNSNHAGAAGVYTAMAMRQGLIAMYFAVASANGMPPWGGKEPLLGTNPIAVAIPGAGEEEGFELDIATTVASHGTIKVQAQSGEPMPEGWVIGRDGQWITDPAKASEGFLVPIGGYKGSGLNIMIGLLAGALNGAAFARTVADHRVDMGAYTNTGQAIFVMRPDLIADPGEYAEHMAKHLHDLRTSEPMGDEPVRMPGDKSREVMADYSAEGIPVAPRVLADLRALAERYDLGDRLDGGSGTP